MPHEPPAASDGALPAFGTLPLRAELLIGVERLGFDAMTDIQAQALPAALQGRDVSGHARTGSGKTVAFGLALLQGVDLSDRSPQALVLCPTRELAHQVTDVVRSLAVGMGGLRVLSVTGGASSRQQRDALAAGAHVVVGTPGRIARHLELGRLSLAGLRCLVLDEADRMLDMGFEEQVLDIVDQAPTPRQTLLFSATWPEAMTAICARIQSDPHHVRVAALVDDQVLRQRAVLCTWETRADALCALLAEREPTPTVVFCETRQQCQEVADHLRRKGASALALHGDLEQRDRDDVLARMRNDSARILVATNVAARGLDMEGLGLVVCYQLSPDPAVHVHRVGRTARAEHAGVAVSLVAGPRELRHLEAIEELMGTVVPRQPAPATSTASLDAWAAPHRTLLVLGGRKDKLRPGDLVGALTRDVGLEGDDIGKIAVSERRTWVAVRANVADAAGRDLGRTRIKKKRFRVRTLPA